MVTENQSNMKLLKKQYEHFERALFDKKMVETKYVIKDTNQLIEKIEQQMGKITEELERGTAEIEKVVPYTKEQRQRLQQIKDDVVDVENRLEASKKKLDNDKK